MRINQYLAKAGLGSRRKVEALVLEGRVTIDGRRITKLSEHVDISNSVMLDGKVLSYSPTRRYLVVNKPIGYTSTVSDPHAQKTVMDLVSDKRGLFPVGRLDKNSRGLMFLTDDGDFALRITHPRYGCEKEYLVTVTLPREDHSEKIERVMRFFKCGTKLGESKTLPAEITLIGVESGKARFRIILKEGRKRQIRRMFEKAGMEVVDLMRTRIGRYEIGDLKSGESRPIRRP